MTQTPIRLMSYEEYRRQPYDGQRTELVEGRVIELNDPTAPHAEVVKALERALEGHIREIRKPYMVWSKVGVQTARSETGRSPDLLVCTYQQWMDLREEENGGASFKLGNPPLIVIEVLSTSTQPTDMGTKQWEYEGAGVSEYWRANHRKRWVEVLTLVGDKYQTERFSGEQMLKSTVLPKLRLTASQVFAPPKLPWEVD